MSAASEQVYCQFKGQLSIQSSNLVSNKIDHFIISSAIHSTVSTVIHLTSVQLGNRFSY